MKDLKPKEILDFAGNFTQRSGKIRRFEAHPYVNGDTLAEHLHHLQRILVCITPFLKEEFPKEKDLVEKISAILSLHDDDEILVGYDIITQLKNHAIDSDREDIKHYKKMTLKLGKKSQEYMASIFGIFRHQDTLAAKIAKALDNIVGNSVLVEQKFALLNPDTTKFTIEYGKKVLGASKTTDALIYAQINQIVTYRKRLRSNQKELKRIIVDSISVDIKKVPKLMIKANKLLKIDILKHKWNKEKTLIPFEDL